MKNKLILNTLVMFLLVAATQSAGATSENDDPARPTLGQTGQIFTLKFNPANKQLTIGLAGNAVAELGPERILILGKQYPAGSKTGKTLSISPDQNKFEILDAIDQNSVLEIEVRDRVSHKKETFKLDQKSRP